MDDEIYLEKFYLLNKRLLVMSSQSSKKTTALRYTEEEKKEIVDFVLAYNAANKRGGQAKATQKYNVSPVTLNSWLKTSEASTVSKMAKKTSKRVAKAAKESANKELEEVPPAGAAASEELVAQDAAPEMQIAPGGKGRRYSSAEKHHILDFIEEYNQTHGRGGQSQAAAKFRVSVMTISGWRKSLAGSFRSRKSAGSINSGVSAALVSKVSNLIEIGNQIRQAETDLAKLKHKFDSLSATIKATL